MKNTILFSISTVSFVLICLSTNVIRDTLVLDVDFYSSLTMWTEVGFDSLIILLPVGFSLGLLIDFLVWKHK